MDILFDVAGPEYNIKNPGPDMLLYEIGRPISYSAVLMASEVLGVGMDMAVKICPKGPVILKALGVKIAIMEINYERQANHDR
jgi:hypothetical protein